MGRRSEAGVASQLKVSTLIAFHLVVIMGFLAYLLFTYRRSILLFAHFKHSAENTWNFFKLICYFVMIVASCVVVVFATVDLHWWTHWLTPSGRSTVIWQNLANSLMWSWVRSSAPAGADSVAGGGGGMSHSRPTRDTKQILGISPHQLKLNFRLEQNSFFKLLKIFILFIFKRVSAKK